MSDYVLQSLARANGVSLDTGNFSWEPQLRNGGRFVFARADCKCPNQKMPFSGRQAWSHGRRKSLQARYLMPSIAFETLIDDSLAKITTVSQLQSLINKQVLSLVNDYEDGKWQYKRFQRYLWDNIAQTALSERERAALADCSQSSLVAAAANLRLTDKDDIGQGSEIAEVFLYGIMRNHFNALPVVPKIFYKQNVKDNAKGADSVHIVVNSAGDDFTLWFGEAKFYSSIEDSRLDSVVNSVFGSLNTEKLRKENAIITNVSDIDQLTMSEKLRAKIKAALSSQVSIDHLKSRIHVPILLLHQCKNTASNLDLSTKYKDEIVVEHTKRAEAYFAKQVAKSAAVFKYNEITFHIILFPVPNKKLIVDHFLNAVTFYKGQA